LTSTSGSAASVVDPTKTSGAVSVPASSDPLVGKADSSATSRLSAPNFASPMSRTAQDFGYHVAAVASYRWTNTS